MYRYLDKPLNASNASEKFIVWVLLGASGLVGGSAIKTMPAPFSKIRF
jgi:hypothetical protein